MIGINICITVISAMPAVFRRHSFALLPHHQLVLHRMLPLLTLPYRQSQSYGKQPIHRPRRHKRRRPLPEINFPAHA